MPDNVRTNVVEGHLHRVRIALSLVLLPAFAVLMAAQNQPAMDPSLPLPPHEKQVRLKHILVIGQTKGFEHDSISDGMVAIYNMGRDSGLWDAVLRSDVELITKKDLGRNAKNLGYFDAMIFVSTTGELDLDDSQKKDMMSFIKDDGKGFVGVHAALDTNYKWPEYGEMIGGWFDEHPWSTFSAPIVNEDPSFPAVRHFPGAFVKYDEIYQAKEWSREKVNVLLSLDPARLNYVVIRFDFGFQDEMQFPETFAPVAIHIWCAYPELAGYPSCLYTMLGMTEGSTASHPRPQVRSDAR